jgi:hypothetical protein
MLNWDVGSARQRYYNFISLSQNEKNDYKLTPNSEESPFALCFALFGLNLIKGLNIFGAAGELYSKKLYSGILEYKKERSYSNSDLRFDKCFLQLLTFSLSALYLTGGNYFINLEDIIKPLIVEDIGWYLEKSSALKGQSQSGNFAMFMAILLIHARDYMGMNTSIQLEQWIELHLKAMNKFGFWGQDRKGMKYLYFQNGYHQYEIFDYLGVDNPMQSIAAENVARLADSQGHFAPYPGGGGCYDYDAVFILTGSKQLAEQYRSLLIKTAQSILSEQNIDGGFSESHYIRPRSLKNVSIFIRFLIDGYRKDSGAQMESVRSFVSLMLPRNDTITNHWSVYSRRWNESDLWDSWFRMQTLARIECALGDKKTRDWGFINYPGIGYHNIFQNVV